MIYTIGVSMSRTEGSSYWICPGFWEALSYPAPGRHLIDAIGFDVAIHLRACAGLSVMALCVARSKDVDNLDSQVA